MPPAWSFFRIKLTFIAEASPYLSTIQLSTHDGVVAGLRRVHRGGQVLPVLKHPSCSAPVFLRGRPTLGPPEAVTAAGRDIRGGVHFICR